MQSKESVQHYLNQLDIEQDFSVIFLKQDGTQRVLTGCLMPRTGPDKEQIPIATTDEGIKSFNINKVLWIGNPQDCITNKESV